jgi:hypothetical protein
MESYSEIKDKLDAARSRLETFKKQSEAPADSSSTNTQEDPLTIDMAVMQFSEGEIRDPKQTFTRY